MEFYTITKGLGIELKYFLVVTKGVHSIKYQNWEVVKTVINYLFRFVILETYCLIRWNLI